MMFDTAGFCWRDLVGEDRRWSKSRPRASCSPPTIRRKSARARAVRDFVRDIRALGKDGEAILSGNVQQAVEERQ